MGRRAEDGGRSECPPVAGGIGVESSGEITPRESGPTSLGSFVTREPGKPLQGASRCGRHSHAGSGVEHYHQLETYRICVGSGPTSWSDPAGDFAISAVTRSGKALAMTGD